MDLKLVKRAPAGRLQRPPSLGIGKRRLEQAHSSRHAPAVRAWTWPSLFVSRTTRHYRIPRARVARLLRSHVGVALSSPVPGKRRSSLRLARKGLILHKRLKRSFVPSSHARLGQSGVYLIRARLVRHRVFFRWTNTGKVADRFLRSRIGRSFGIGPTEGLPVLRKALADRQGIPPKRCLVVSGSQPGLDLIARLPGRSRRTVMSIVPPSRSDPGLSARQARTWSAGISPGGTSTSSSVILRHRPKLLLRQSAFHNRP